MKARFLLKMIMLVFISVRVNAQYFDWNVVSYTAGTLNTNFGSIGSPAVNVSMNITGYTAGLPGGNPAKRRATPDAGTGTTCPVLCALRYAPTFSNPATQNLIVTFTFSTAIAALSFPIYDIDGTGGVIDSVRITASGPSGAVPIVASNANLNVCNIFGSGTTVATIKGGTGNRTDPQVNIAAGGGVSTLVFTFMGQGSFSIGNMSWTGILPFKWISFSGKKQNNATVNLHWLNANEVDANNYEIEKSEDGQSFRAIGTLPALLNGNNEYTFTDARPGTGINYYRIKHQSNNNRISYSSVVTVMNRENNNEPLVIFPNPVKNTLNISLPNNATIKGIQIFNAQGKLICSYLNANKKLDLGSLTTGLYFLKVENNSGETFRKSFYKQ